MADVMETITSLAKRRGLVFPSSEIYGGLRSSWDYGPLGVELKKNVKNAWWRSMVQYRDDVVGLDASILMSPKVWETSGHVQGFTDPLVECPSCRKRFREDELTMAGQAGDRVCPSCGTPGLSEARQFNLMFETHMGPVADDAHSVYLRPETAQGIFVDFPTVQTATRKKIPFGIAQIGKSFRNEITPGNFIFRTREFEQMEMEFFVEPSTAEAWYETWFEARYQWYTDLGIRPEKLRARDHEPDELAHYATAARDVEYEFPFGWSELEGVANRQDFDLRVHMEASGEDMRYFDQEKEEHYLPYVIEPAAGADRATLAFLLDAYREEEAPNAKGEMERRVVMRLHKDLAPTKVAVLPLSRKDTLSPTARQVFDAVKVRWMCDYDDAGSIGRRYRRQDEVGTPYCVTVDFDSLDDQQVTVRERDEMKQDRIPIEGLVRYLEERL